MAEPAARDVPGEVPVNAFATVPDSAPRDCPVKGHIGVVLTPIEGMALLNLRTAPGTSALRDALQARTGLLLPDTALATASDPHGRARALWIGPGDWLIRCTAPDRAEVEAALSAALSGTRGALVDVGHGWTALNLQGRHAADVLAAGCGLDLDPQVFGAGQCAMTGFGKLRVVIERRADPPRSPGAAPAGQSYDVYVARSFAGSLQHLLVEAAGEYGYRIAAPARLD